MKKLVLRGGFSLLIVLLLAIGCEQVKDPLIFTQFKVDQNVSMFSSANGVDKRIFYTYENVVFSFENLYPNEQTDIQIIRLSDNNVIKRLLVFTDEYGAIKNLPIWYYNNFLKPGELGGDHKFYVHLIQPGVTRPWIIYSIPFESRDQLPPTPQIRVTDMGGVFKGGTIYTGQGIYVEGSGFLIHQEIKLVVVDNSDAYNVGDPLTDVSNNGIQSMMVDRDGNFPPTLVFSSARPGAYDVIADTEPFGVYNVGDVVNDPMFTGVVVQSPSIAGDIIQDIACDELGYYKNVFDSLETIYARVNSNFKPGYLQSEFVSVYITPHKPVWKKDDPLISLRTVGTFEMPIHCLWNGWAGSFPPIRIHGRSLPDDPAPIKFWPGEYDMIIDVDRNDLYDPGIDILDGGSQPGFVVPGKVPPVRFGVCAEHDFLGRYEGDPLIWGYFRDQIKTKVWGVLVDSTGQLISQIPINFAITSGPGSLTNTTATTDINGSAYTTYSGGTWGSHAVVRLDATVFNRLYTKDVLILRKIPHTHNQGIIIGN
ncbi:MAG: Ig-like domain-containing protein [Anaerolineales bacterium]|nr:Ig-like domain-containing protein [Anaerolineales bacterium]